MDSRPFSLKLSPLLVLAVLAGVPSVEAQPAATNAWKPIIFSSPDNNEISSNPISLSTQPLAPADFRSLFQDASRRLPSFNDFGPAPMPNAGRRSKNPPRSPGLGFHDARGNYGGDRRNKFVQTGKRDEDGQPGKSDADGTLPGRANRMPPRFDRSGNSSPVTEFLGRRKRPDEQRQQFFRSDQQRFG